jgi:hypothetical protein
MQYIGNQWNILILDMIQQATFLASLPERINDSAHQPMVFGSSEANGHHLQLHL